FLVEAFGWRSVFLVAVPLSLLIVPAALWVLRESERGEERERGFDVPGAAMLTTGLFGGLLSLSQGRSWGWTDIRTLAGFAVFAVLLSAFVLWERRAERPMIDLGLFRYRSLVSANIAGFFSSGSMFGTFVMLPFFFQSVLGRSPAETGLRMAPLALMFLVVAPLGGRLTNRLGARTTPMLGLVLAALGYLAVSRMISVDAGYLELALSLALAGVGLGLTMAPLTTAALHDVPPAWRGVASSLPQMSRFIGGSFGMAVVGALLSWRVTAHLAEAGVTAGGPGGAAGAGGAGAGAISDPALQMAFAQSFQDVFLMMVLMVGAALVAASFVPPLRPGAEEG
ncbi:MAG: MFS transporter, partial [Pseudomonadota bacterium]